MKLVRFGAAVRIVAFGLLGGSSIAADAQGQVPVSLQQLVATPGYQANVARLFSQLPPDVFQRCPALVSRGSSVTVIEPAVFAADGYPTAGLWRQSFPVSGCGNDTTINFFFKAGPDKKIASVVALPGDTHAGLQLQRDAVRYAVIAVQAKAAGCAMINVRTTSYTRSASGAVPGPAGRAEPWRETWTLSACGRRYVVPMTFVPDATGTTISASPAQAIEP